jgi:hypothetical protein
MTEDEYWIVAKTNESRYYGSTQRDKDSIILTCIPYNFRRGLKRDEILVCEVEKLQHSDLMNIHINVNYAPFQSGMIFYNVYTGYPIKCNVKEFMIKALELKSDDICDYKELAEKAKEPIIENESKEFEL